VPEVRTLDQEGGCLDDQPVSRLSGTETAGQETARSGEGRFPPIIAGLLSEAADCSPENLWDKFLAEFGDLLLKTAKYAYRRYASKGDAHDAAMDAYTFILEKLREDAYRRLRGFSGGDRDALSRWLVVVARRLCTDFWRHQYGRARPSTSETDREARRRLLEEIWDPKDPSELPSKSRSGPDWELRLKERREALGTAVQELPAKDQLLLALRFDEGLSARRIADLLEFSTPFHVYRQINRALAFLKRRLEARGINDPDP